MYPHYKKEESILLQKHFYRGLRPTPSGWNRRFNTTNSNSNNSNQNKPPTNASIPFGAEMIEPMMELFEPCPAGEFGLRVFQQHIKQGTCWNDSMYMIVFNSDELKPFIRPILRRLMELNAEEGTLDFGTVGTPVVKLHGFAQTLRAEFNPSGSIAVWELFVLNAQRYLQLLYLFLHDPSVKNTVANQTINYSRLMTRRKSLQCNTYTDLHAFTKSSLTYETFGAHDSHELIVSVNYFLKSISPEGYTYKFDDIQPADHSTIHGYYLIKYKHVISLFRCNGVWILYDNEIGSEQLSPDDSAKLDGTILKEFGKTFTHTTCTYTIILENDEQIQVEMKYSGKPEIVSIHERMPYRRSKYYLIKQPTDGVVATTNAYSPLSVPFKSTENNSIPLSSKEFKSMFGSMFGIPDTPDASLNRNNEQEGGRRRHRKTQRKRRHARKKTRSYK
jgi:hypothetical protein